MASQLLGTVLQEERLQASRGFLEGWPLFDLLARPVSDITLEQDGGEHRLSITTTITTFTTITTTITTMTTEPSFPLLMPHVCFLCFYRAYEGLQRLISDGCVEEEQELPAGCFTLQKRP